MFGYLDVREFGAVGDGIHDDTPAIQKAIDAASEVHGTVKVPPGTYLVSQLKMRPGMEMNGNAEFSYRSSFGSVLKLIDSSDSDALIDMTDAYGAKVSSLCLVGCGPEHPKKTHGIMIEKPDYGKQEDTPCIDNCRIENFSGDGIHFSRIWCFSVRHSHMMKNGGHGLWIRGWDGFILDNWMSGNYGGGYCADLENASVTMTGNRIEWNHGGGIVIKQGSHYNITGNYIDRSGNSGALFVNSNTITFTGNIVYRSGKIEWKQDSQDGEKAQSAQIFLKNSRGIVATSNSLCCGRDDGGRGEYSPHYGIVVDGCKNSCISLNTLSNGALKELVSDGGNNQDCVIKDNPGTLFQE